MKIFIILFAIYVAQILIVGAYPYYKYRKDHKEGRTIGGFMYYMDKHMDFLKFAMFFPFFGIALLLLGLIIFFILGSFVWIYERFIKDIKI